MNYENVKVELEKWQKAYKEFFNHNTDDKHSFVLEIAPPAAEEEILIKEKELGIKLPKALREFFLNVSSRICSNISFELEDEKELPYEFYGLINYTQSVVSLQELYITHDFDDIEQGEYGKVFQNKLDILPIGDGDYVSIDLTSKSGESVVWVANEENEAWEIAPNFIDFFDNWLKVGLADLTNSLIVFCSVDHPLDGNSENAKLWRKIMFSNANERKKVVDEYNEVQGRTTTLSKKYSRDLSNYILVGIAVLFLILLLITFIQYKF